MFNVTDFGAIGDGIHDDTPAIKAAVEACRAAGGGTVVFPAGTFLSTPFELFSYINLHLEAGATLLGSADAEKFVFNESAPESTIIHNRPGLIRTVEAKSVSITGTGTIDCQGMKYMDITRPRQPAPGNEHKYIHTRQGEGFRKQDNGLEDGPATELDRPGMYIQFIRCENVTVRDIVILDAPFWTFHFYDSRNIVVSGLTIQNDLVIPNCDGLHFQACHNVRVSDCHITSADDCFAFTGYGPDGASTENVVVNNCTLVSRSAAIRVGYGKLNIRNMLFNNITITNSNRGIGVFQKDAGLMENIVFSNVVIETRLHTGHWLGVGEPIHVSSGKFEGAEYGRLRNIRFSNILARGESGMVVHGFTENVIEDVVFDNVRFEVVPSKLAERYGGNFDLRPIDDPKVGLFGHHECGLFAQQVRGLQVRNFHVHWAGAADSYFRHGLELNECENVEIDGYVGEAPHQSETSKPFHVERCRDVRIRNSKGVPKEWNGIND